MNHFWLPVGEPYVSGFEGRNGCWQSIGITSKPEERSASALRNEHGAVLVQALPASGSLNALEYL